MKDKDKLSLLLKAFKLGNIEFDYALNFILQTYSSSNRFNLKNFLFGIYFGAILMYVIMKYIFSK